jgi:Zn-dependent peptidase ImmA (M78 family)/DNA-binding XRE family transcriptional regulator
MNRTFNREMLVLARESRGYTQTTLAARVGLAPSLISKFESGIVAPTPENLRKIAESLEFPEPFFSQTDKVYGLGCSFLYHRKRKTMPIPEQRRLLAKLNVLRMRIERMLRGTEMESENAFLPIDPEQHGGPENVARLVRSAWRLPPGPVACVVGAIESAGGLVVAHPFDNDRADGMSWWLPNLPPLFFVNADMPGERQRFTLSHEIGHIIMHRVPSETIEDEADRFASEFLMPAKDILPDLSGLNLERAAALKAYWRVSIQAIVRRAFDLKKITAKRYQGLFKQISAAGYRKQEPMPLAQEEPTLLRSLVELHLEQHGYEFCDLSAMALTNVQEFREQFAPDYHSRLRMAQ